MQRARVTFQPQSPGSQRIVPASPGFWADILPRSSLGGLHCICNRSTIHRIVSQRAREPSFWDCEAPRGLRRTPPEKGPGSGPRLATRIAIQAQSEWAQIRSNWSAIRPNYIRIALNPESSCNRPDCKYRGLDCGRIAKIRKSPFWGLRGTERIAWGPRSRVWACPPVWAQT